jgi:hypothetical protein
VLPDAPYITGRPLGRATLHGIRHQRAVRAAAYDTPLSRWTSAECGTVVVIADELPVFEPSALPVYATVCGQCSWAAAITAGDEAIAAQLDRLTPTGRDLDILALRLADPLIARHTAEKLLARLAGIDEVDRTADCAPFGELLQLLGHVARHVPVVLMTEDCAEDSCDHRTDDQTFKPWVAMPDPGRRSGLPGLQCPGRRLGRGMGGPLPSRRHHNSPVPGAGDGLGVS